MSTPGYLFWTAVERRSLAAVSDRPEMWNEPTVGIENVALWIDLQGVGLVEFAPDVELQYVVGTDDVCVWVYIAILTDARLVRA